LCWLASVAVVAIPPLKAVELGPVEVNPRIVLLVVISILIGAAWGCAADDRGRRYAVGVALAGLLAAILLPSPSLVLVYATSQFLGLVVYWANAAIVQEVEQSPAAPIRPLQLRRAAQARSGIAANCRRPASKR
jgi:hypothetical protein